MLDGLTFLGGKESLLREAVEVFVRTIVLYLVALALLRITGKRSLAKMSAFDFVVAVTIGSAIAIGMEADNNFVPALLPLVILSGLQWLLARLNLQMAGVETATRGRSVTLVRNGRAESANLRRERITGKELAMELRQKGYAGVKEVAEARLETTGKVSVLPTQEAKPLTQADLKALAAAVADEVVRRQKGARAAAEKQKA